MEYTPANTKGKSLLTLSVFFAFMALLSIQYVILPFILGGLSILFALLSRGCMPNVSATGRIAITVSSVAMVLTVFVAAFAVRMVLTDSTVRKQVNDYSLMLYGQTFDDMIEETFHTKLPEPGEPADK